MAKIMLVEDDKSLREIYSIRLVAEGYDIVSAGDGEEALGLAVHEKPDLIIADVMMPKISGFDMLDILRSTPETSKIKVIMMTALSSEDQRRRGEQLGAERYLVKSQVGIEDVINAVHEVLGDKPNSGAHANLDTVAAIPAKPAEAPTTQTQLGVAPAPQQMAPQPAAAIPQAPTTAPVPSIPPTAPAPTVPTAVQPIQMAPQAATQQSASAGVSERIIQPIHDPRAEEDRQEMQKKMTEMLGGEENLVPQAVTTETADELTRAAEEQARAAAQAEKAAQEAARQAAERAQKAAAQQQAAMAAQAAQAQALQAAQAAAQAAQAPTVAPIQPAYETALRDQLAAEGEVDPQNPIAVRMANDLKEELAAATKSEEADTAMAANTPAAPAPTTPTTPPATPTVAPATPAPQSQG